MRRAMNVLESGSPQEAYLYDHPYFGQIVLSGVLWLAGYPDSLSTTTDPESLESLYLAPRVLMGLLAVLDTFLVYKITEKRFGRRTAIIASILFAVMPMSWLLRRILLDSLLLPFVLSSVLLALYAQDSNKKHALLVSSGACLGLAIFTKVPAFTFIPLVLFLVYSPSRKLRDAGIWLVPTFLIPLVWPVYSLFVGQFDLWVRGVLWQAGKDSIGLSGLVGYVLKIDPTLLLFGIAGFAFAAIRRDMFTVLWFAPLLLFFASIGFIQYFHWIPLMPVMCIAAAIMINKGIDKAARIVPQNYTMAGTVLVISTFGLLVTSTIISIDASSSQFEALSFVLERTDNNTTILANPVYSWILYGVHDKENTLRDYSLILFEPIKTERVLLIADPHFMLDIHRGPELEQIYNDTATIMKFRSAVDEINTSQFPNENYRFTREGKMIDIRINWDPGTT